MPTCVGHTARSALAELGESLNKPPAVDCESFEPTVQFENLKYIQYFGVPKPSFVTKSFAILSWRFHQGFPGTHFC